MDIREEGVACTTIIFRLGSIELQIQRLYYVVIIYVRLGFFNGAFARALTAIDAFLLNLIM